RSLKSSRCADFHSPSNPSRRIQQHDVMETLLNQFAWLVPLLFLLAVLLPAMFRVLREYERGVVFRLGKLLRAKGPGLIVLIPFVDRMVRVDMRIVTNDVPKQEMMTSDNVPVTVDAVLY